MAIVIMDKLVVRRVGPESVALARLATELTMSCPSSNEVKLVMRSLPGLEGTSIEMDIGEHYPFRPPTVTVNSKSYVQMLCYNVPSLALIMRSITGGTTCMCCKSVVCGNNWYPGLNLCKVLSEVRESLEVRKKTIQIYYCRKIAETHLTYDVPLESYL